MITQWGIATRTVHYKGYSVILTIEYGEYIVSVFNEEDGMAIFISTNK